MVIWQEGKVWRESMIPGWIWPFPTRAWEGVLRPLNGGRVKELEPEGVEPRDHLGAGEWGLAWDSLEYKRR